jgi:hypothetical protein
VTSFAPEDFNPAARREDDPVARLNETFRSLYSLNREQALMEIPVAALTLIGTGEIWRFDHGRAVKCYRPPELLPKTKGLMHAVLGVHGTWRLLLRDGKAPVAKQAAAALSVALDDAVARATGELPENLAAPAKVVLGELRRLAEGWSRGQATTAEEFPASLARVQPHLQAVIRTIGEAAYNSLRDSFQSLREECEPAVFRECVVGVCGPGQGRRDNIEIAAAMSVMGPEAAGVRLFYLENALTIPDGLKCLASIAVEKDLGKAVFDDPYRMWRDLLCDAATRHLGRSFFIELGPT